jgi:hypothetical protein
LKTLQFLLETFVIGFSAIALAGLISLLWIYMFEVMGTLFIVAMLIICIPIGTIIMYRRRNGRTDST